MNRPDLETSAESLAQIHYRVEPGMICIHEIESDDGKDEIKLLEVNTNTFSAGIMPLRFDAVPTSGIHFPSVIVEVSPAEYEQIKRQELKLPEGWKMGRRVVSYKDREILEYSGANQ